MAKRRLYLVMGNSISGIYEVLSPWAEADPVPVKGIAERIADLEGKRIGLFRNSKRAAPLALDALQKRLKERYPTVEFSPFALMPNAGILETEDKDRFEEWIKEVDGVVFAFGD
jgi:hypothetical protein